MENKQLSLVNFEQADRLKKAGFNWATTHFYVDAQEEKTAFAFWRLHPVAYGHDPRNWNIWEVGSECGNTSAPTVALALQYMRNVHNLCGDIYRIACGWVWSINKADSGTSVEDLNERGPNDGGAFDDFDDCASNVLDELLTLIEK